MSSRWPWRGSIVEVWDLMEWNLTVGQDRDPQAWVLTDAPVGTECIARPWAKDAVLVGSSPCQRIVTQWPNQSRVWWPEEPKWYPTKKDGRNCTIWMKTDGMESTGLWNCTGNNPYQGIPVLRDIWNKVTSSGPAPEGLLWICGHKAYSVLPTNWSGTCFIGLVQPGFFLLNTEEGRSLGTPVFDDLYRKKRKIDIGEWEDDEWPPARIISYYGPATWAQDGSWGYRTPVYMLNRIIRLQAVLEVITNQTAVALEMLAKQQTQMRAAIYQNRLALDYLLAEEGGVCGKFNLSNCCLNIDDNGQAVMDISEGIRKLAHVPIQKWNSIMGTRRWDSILRGTWWRTVGLVFLCAVAGLIFIPCCIPCFRELITRSISQMQAVVVPTGEKGVIQKIMIMRPGKVQDPQEKEIRTMLRQFELKELEIEV